MKRIFSILTLLALCLPAFAQFNPYESSTLLTLLPPSLISQGATTNYTASSGSWIDTRGYVGIAAVTVNVYSNSAGNTVPFTNSQLVVKIETSVDMTNATAFTLASLATSGATIVSNFTYTAGSTNGALTTTNTVFTPSYSYASAFLWPNVTAASATLSGGVPVTSMKRYIRLTATTYYNTNATWVVSANVRMRASYAQ